MCLRVIVGNYLLNNERWILDAGYLEVSSTVYYNFSRISIADIYRGIRCQYPFSVSSSWAGEGACPAPRPGPPVRWLVESRRSHAPARSAAVEGVSRGVPWKGCGAPRPPPARSPAHAHARPHGRVAAGVRKRSVEQRSYGAASTAAEEGSMSATRAKKVKMATKSCPECDQQVGRAGASGRAGRAGRAAVARRRLAVRGGPRPGGSGGGLEAGTRRCRFWSPAGPRPPTAPGGFVRRWGECGAAPQLSPPPPGWQHKADKRTVMVLTFCKFVDFRNTAIKPVLMGDGWSFHCVVNGTRSNEVGVEALPLCVRPILLLLFTVVNLACLLPDF